MKKIISMFLLLAVCFMLTAYAEEQKIFSSGEPMAENAGVLLDYENLNNDIEFLEQLEAEPFDTEILNTNEIPELIEDNGSMLYAASSSVVASGECGENGNNLTWQLDSNGTLTISGSGNLANYQSNSEVPWNGYANQISAVNLDITTDSLCPSEWNHAFGMLSKVSKIEIPEGVTEIPESNRLFPETLRKLVLPSTYTGELSHNYLIRYMNFLDIEVVEDNPVYCSIDGTLFSKDKTKLIQYTRSAIEPNYVVPDTVRDIDGAFFNNRYLKTLTISKNVEIVDIDTFNNEFGRNGMGMDICAMGSEAVYVDEENPYFCSVDGVLYNKDMSILIWCPSRKSGDFYVPESVKVIASGAFQYSQMSYIYLPSGIEILGRHAFAVSSLQSMSLPEGITEVNSSCFFSCYTLSKVYIGADETAKYSIQLFDNCPNLKTAGPIGSGCDIEFCWTKTIPEFAFSYCTNLLNVTIPEGIKSIENDAFYNCASLTEVTIPHSVSAIGYYVFEKCTALSNIYVDNVEGMVSGAPWDAPNANVTYLREINIAPIPKNYIYTGYEITPDISITEDRKDGTASTTLIEDKDYTLTYSDNTNAGTAKVMINYINDYANLGSAERTFTIIPRNSNKLIIAPISDKAYTSRAITPNPTITDNI